MSQRAPFRMLWWFQLLLWPIPMGNMSVHYLHYLKMLKDTFSEISFSKNSYHTETGHTICKEFRFPNDTSFFLKLVFKQTIITFRKIVLLKHASIVKHCRESHWLQTSFWKNHIHIAEKCNGKSGNLLPGY